MNAPLVSVVIPTHGRSEFLPRALRSAVRQSYSNFEVIVVDDNGDGSPHRSNTKKLVAGLGDERFRVVYNPECLGASGARNAGIAAAAGEFVAFLDDDDEFLPNKLSASVAKFAEVDDPRLSMVYGFARMIFPGGKFVDYRDVFKGNCLQELFCRGGIAATSQMVWRRAILQEIGGFPIEEGKEDTIILVRLFERGFTIDCVTEVLSNYFEHSGQRVSSSLNSLRGEERLFALSARHFGEFSPQVVRQIRSASFARLAVTAFGARRYLACVGYIGRLIRMGRLGALGGVVISFARITRRRFAR